MGRHWFLTWAEYKNHLEFLTTINVWPLEQTSLSYRIWGDTKYYSSLGDPGRTEDHCLKTTRGWLR